MRCFDSLGDAPRDGGVKQSKAVKRQKRRSRRRERITHGRRADWHRAARNVCEEVCGASVPYLLCECVDGRDGLIPETVAHRLLQRFHMVRPSVDLALCDDNRSLDEDASVGQAFEDSGIGVQHLRLHIRLHLVTGAVSLGWCCGRGPRRVPEPAISRTAQFRRLV